MSRGVAAWRILRPAHKGVSLVIEYYGDSSRWALQAQYQREFAEKLRKFLVENGYSAQVVAPNGVGFTVTREEVDSHE